jgi:nitroimidazol reductase NimA-like FMN-containing flavoprotein (pyridoxamine 5'-phosphate oxidase superfamily)
MRWTKARKLRFLQAAPIIRVATVNRRGQPHVTPVCHVEFKGRIYWASDPDTAKVANLSRRRTVALVADIYKAGWRDMGGVMAQGRAKLIREGPLFRRIRGLLYRKFKVYRSNAPFEERESVIIEVTPSCLISWWYE